MALHLRAQLDVNRQLNVGLSFFFSCRYLTELCSAAKQDELMDMYRHLFIPMFVAEYKKVQGAFSIQGPNQVRSNIVAALKFLATCGIEEILLFSLYTEGTVGVVQAGWKEEGPRLVVRTSPFTSASSRLIDLSEPRFNQGWNSSPRPQLSSL